MTNYKEINGEMFEVIKAKNISEMIENYWKNYNGHTLDYYYEKPSAIKKAIYNEWREWASYPNIWAFQVSSANTFNFTLGAILVNDHGKDIGVIRITKAHNYLYM